MPRELKKWAPAKTPVIPCLNANHSASNPSGEQLDLLAPAESLQNSTPLRPGTKRHAVLRVLLDRGSEGLNCFQAVRLCNDFVLRSTISDLQIGHDIVIHRRSMQVPNSFGGTTACARYWIAPEWRPKALALLGIAQ